jgi:hypothetical protein
VAVHERLGFHVQGNCGFWSFAETRQFSGFLPFGPGSSTGPSTKWKWISTLPWSGCASAVVGLEPFGEDAIEALHRAGADVVLPVQDVSSAMQQLGRMQADHLICADIDALATPCPPIPPSPPMAEARLQGVTAACAAAELAPPVVLAVSLDDPDAAPVVTGWTAREVTGVCAYNDEIAIAVLAGMRDQGLTAPTDLAAIGADDILTARFASPPLVHSALRLIERSST